jgi:hypothetical protein
MILLPYPERYGADQLFTNPLFDITRVVTTLYLKSYMDDLSHHQTNEKEEPSVSWTNNFVQI